MKLVRLFHFGIAVLLLGSVPAMSDGMLKGEGRRVTHREAHTVIERYGSIPGDGMLKVKGEGRRATHREARTVVERYGSMPGDGMLKIKGEGRRATRREAHAAVERYGSIPGDGMLKVKGEGRRATRREAHAVVERYGSIPGGLILEGKATGIDWATDVHYDGARGFFLLQDRFSYVPPIAPASVAMLAKAIAKDDRVGVSIGEELTIVYGSLPRNSPAASDMLLTDNFLGDFILPPREWTVGYKLAGGFQPRDDTGTAVAAVFFRFSDFDLAVNGDKLELAGASFLASVVPIVTGKRMADGGFVPDYAAIEQPGGFDAFEANAKHIGVNIGYYLQEPIVARALAYGETAAFLRSLKANGVDLDNLAQSIDDAATASAATGSPSSDTDLENSWQTYLRQIQADNTFPNWTAPPYDLYLSRLSEAAAADRAQEAIAARP